MKHKITSTFLVLALLLIMGTVVAADEQGYNGMPKVSADDSKENTTENDSDDNTTNPTGLAIEQQQFQRTISNGIVSLEEYAVDGKLVAGVYESESAFNQYEAVTIQGKTYKFWREIENAVDDIVVVYNDESKSDTTAYIRTVFAFPVFSDGEKHLHLNFHVPEGVQRIEEVLEVVEGIAEIKGQKYQLYVYNYNAKLALGQTSEPSLLEYVFDKDVTSELFDEFPENTYKILIASQAVQENGVSTFAKVLNGAFSNVTANNHPWSE